MANCVIIHCRIPSKSKRVTLEDVNFSAKVAEFKIGCAKALDLAIHETELIFCGQRLKDSHPLASYGIKPGVTVHALKKVVTEEEEIIPERMDNASIQQVVTALQTALMNPAYRNTVEHMLARPDTLENLIAATPGLDKDPVAMAMLQEPDLLGLLADPAHIHKVIESHPAIGQAAMLVAAAVNEERETTAESRNSTRATYSLDQMSDDEEMPLARGPVSGTITANQLAAALAAAGGGPVDSLQPSASGSSQPSASQATAESITSDFFRQALMHAATGGNSSQSMASSTPVVTEAQLQQMRDMGITDESVARRALEASGGDIQSALELIFGDGGGF